MKNSTKNIEDSQKIILNSEYDMFTVFSLLIQKITFYV